MDSNNPLPQLAPSQAANILARINELVEIISAAGLYGRSPFVTGSGGLVWGYQGGRYRSQAIASGTLTLAANATNYIVCARSDGAISVSTSTTNWNQTQTYERLYRVTTNATQVTGWEDHRQVFGSPPGAVASVNGRDGEVVLSMTDALGSINPQTASYVAVLADEVVVMTVGSDNTFTVPPNSSVAFPVGKVLEVWQGGAGQTEIVAGSGVSILRHASLSLKLRGQDSGCALRKVGTNTWRLVGDMEPAA